MNWYRSKAAERNARGQTAHGTPRIYKCQPKPGHERISSIVDEMVEILHAVYQHIPYGYQVRVNMLARKLASVKKHNPRRRVRVV